MLAALPLLAFVIVLYNVLVFATDTLIQGVALVMLLPSGVELAMTNGDLLVLAGLVMLYFEIFKVTRTGAAAVVDHILSIAVFLGCVLELLILPEMATIAFVLLTLMALIDVIAGFTVTIAQARHGFIVDDDLRP